MNTTRIVPTTNDTAPPGAMLIVAASDPYGMTEVVEAGTRRDWTKIEAYAQGSMAIGTAVKSEPMRIVIDTGLYNDHVRAPLLHEANLHRQVLTHAIEFDAVKCKNLIMLSRESSLTAHERVCTFTSYNAHADIKAANIIQLYADLLEEFSDQLKGYEKFQTANWDGHGAEAINASTLAYARKLTKVMPTSLGAADFAPAADGTIALEWVPDEHPTLSKLFLDIGPGEEWTAYWKLRDGQFDTVTSRGFHPVTTSSILQNLFDHLSK
ncbi:hypothetical protein IVA94_18100 [Bradyrhizobium sp. 156]|uniref:hypothetical protein n=1 Tax=Bradyrhizobium sp. 156 TaxID=2782630 RepID=UPI001FF904E7|nr:hypothetical protein [Bradyrhizobium sp. 156]MCK1322773.1 hypothetical protein [Bradyrhizobium sp. 156]